MVRSLAYRTFQLRHQHLRRCRPRAWQLTWATSRRSARSFLSLGRHCRLLEKRSSSSNSPNLRIQSPRSRKTHKSSQNMKLLFYESIVIEYIIRVSRNTLLPEMKNALHLRSERPRPCRAGSTLALIWLAPRRCVRIGLSAGQALRYRPETPRD